MRAIRPDNRRRSGWRTLLLILVAIPVGGAGTVAALGAMHVVDLEKLAFWRKPVTIPPGWVGIPVCTRPIPAYTAVTREYLLDPEARDGSWKLDYQPPEKVAELVRKGVIADIDKIRGRVTARDKGAPFYFSEDDFLPLGTRPGVVGGTPPGKRTCTLDVSKLKGVVHDLKEGDHFDLLASIPVDMPGSSRASSNRLGNVVASPDAALLPKRSKVVPLVQDGVVITPVRLRPVPIGMSHGMVSRTVPVQEIVVAIDPHEVALLAEAKDLNYEITCVARSGQAMDRPAVAAVPASDSGTAAASESRPLEGKSEPPARAAAQVAAAKSRAGDGTPGLDPMDKVRYMEVMVGTQRQFVVFAGPGGSPVVQAQAAGAANPGAAAGAAAAEGSKP